MRRFQPGESPSRGLLRDYEPSDGSFSSSTTEHHTLYLGPQLMVCREGGGGGQGEGEQERGEAEAGAHLRAED